MINVSVTDSLAESRLSLSLKLVKAILSERGEITVGEIEAIPMVETSTDVEMILNYLRRHENVEIVQRKVANYPVIRWERIVQAKS